MSRCGMDYGNFKVRLVEKLNEHFNGTSEISEKETKLKIRLENEKIMLDIPLDKIEEIYDCTAMSHENSFFEANITELASDTIIRLSEERILKEFKGRIRKNKNADWRLL